MVETALKDSAPPPRMPAVMPPWATRKQRYERFLRRRLNEVLPMMERVTQARRAELLQRDQRLLTGASSHASTPRDAAVERRARWVAQHHVLERNAITASLAAARGRDAEAMSALISRHGDQLVTPPNAAPPPSGAEDVAIPLAALTVASYEAPISNAPEALLGASCHKNTALGSVAEAYANDAKRRGGSEVFVLPPLHLTQRAHRPQMRQSHGLTPRF